MKVPTENSYEVFKTNLKRMLFNTEAKIVFNMDVVGYLCVDKKRKHFCHASCSNIRLELNNLSVGSWAEIGNWKEQGVIIIFCYSYLNLLFRDIRNPIGNLNNLSFILGRSGENSKLRVISFSVSLWTGKAHKIADLL